MRLLSVPAVVLLLLSAAVRSGKGFSFLLRSAGGTGKHRMASLLAVAPPAIDVVGAVAPVCLTATQDDDTFARNDNDVTVHELAAARRQIKRCKSVEQVLNVVQRFVLKHPPHNDSSRSIVGSSQNVEPLIADAIAKCGKFRNATAALDLFHRYAPPHSELCRAKTISICGSQGRVDECLSLLQQTPPLSTSGPYNSAIAACGRQKDWQSGLHVLRNLMPKALVTSSLTINTVLTSLSKAKRGTEALELLREMESTWGVAPNRISYHNALSALLGQGEIDKGCDLIQDMIDLHHHQHDNNPNVVVAPNHETFRRLASHVSNRPHDKAMIRERFGNRNALRVLNDNDVSRQLFDELFGEFHCWTLPRMGHGKTACWKIGEIHNNKNPEESLIVGLMPNKNPSSNGIRINFYRPPMVRLTGDDNDDDDGDGNDDDGDGNNNRKELGEKLGYLLMINSKGHHHHDDDCSDSTSYSQFLGQFVDETERGNGWAKVWLAVWFQLCLDAGIQPRTGIIQKPLLSLVLQHSFHMIPREGGIAAELSPGDEPGTVRLYSESRALEGAFSPLDLRHQRIQLSRFPSNPRGRPIDVNTCFDGPGEAVLRECITAALKPHEGSWTMVEGVTPSDLRNILLGTH